MASHVDFSRENKSQLSVQQGMSDSLTGLWPADIALQLAFLEKGM